MTRARLVIAVVVVAAAPAHADDASVLARAQQALDELDYATAQALAAQALASGGLAPDELAAAHRLAGETAAAIGDAAAATRHFLLWLAIDPGAALPAGASPKLTAPFDAARAEAARRGPLRATARATADGGRVRVEVDVQDPYDLAARLRVVGPDGEVTVDGFVAELDGPANGAVPVSLLDTQGNVIARLSVPAPAAAATPVDVGAPAPAPRAGLPAILRWPTWTGLAVVAGATGGYFAYRVGQAEDELAAINADPGAHSFDDAAAVQDRGDRDALVANIAFGVAGAAAVAAILSLVLEPDRARDAVEVAPLIVPGAAGAAARITF